MKLAAEWIVKNHYLGSFPSATVCYGIFRSGELTGVAVLGTAQHKNTIPNVFGPAHAKDCLLLQRFALEAVLEFNAESYLLARVRALLKREGYCGILTIAMKRRKLTRSAILLFPVISGRFLSDNAVYLGRSARLDEYLFADGNVLSNRSFSKSVNNESGRNYMARTTDAQTKEFGKTALRLVITPENYITEEPAISAFSFRRYAAKALESRFF